MGYPDTTQDADIFPERSAENGRAIADALKDLGFELGEAEVAEIVRGKDFVQLKNGPFDLELIFAPDGIEYFEDAWKRRVVVDGFQTTSLPAKSLRIERRIVSRLIG